MPETLDLHTLKSRIALAMGERPVDLLIKNARLVNVLSGDIHDADVAVADGVVVGFGDYQAKEIVDAGGAYLAPGLMDGHIHIESTLLTPREFAKAAARRGTCAVMADPHEIANVLGTDGVEFMLASASGSPVTIYFTAPSCVPATDMETSGATLTAADIARLLQKHPKSLLGLAELMNFPAVIHKAPDVLDKIMAARGRVIDGHAPMVRDKELNAYIIAGPGSDHECTTIAEAREKLRKGVHIMIREGANEHNMRDLIRLVTPENSANFSLVSDDIDPVDLKRRGHVDYLLRRAVSYGISPITALQTTTINTARYFRLRNRGAVAPGYRADLVLFKDLEKFDVKDVYLAGKNINELNFDGPMSVAPPPSMHVGGSIEPETFRIKMERGGVRVIGVVRGQILTDSLVMAPAEKNGFATADPTRDLAKLAVIERHHASGNVGLGFAHGLRLAKGAMASSMAHDSHNLITAGTNDADMALAANTLINCGGGFTIVANGRVLGLVELPIAGLMTDKPLDVLEKALGALGEAYSSISSEPEDAEAHPFMTMAFMALPVIPSLRLTDKGLVDVVSFSPIPLFTG